MRRNEGGCSPQGGQGARHALRSLCPLWSKLLGNTALAPLLLALALSPRETLRAQSPSLSIADSALVGRVLLAEDRRDSTDAALRDAAGHADPRIQAIARRALARIRDDRFASRDSLAALAPPLPTPKAWPEPAWRIRMRALTTQRGDCGALLAAMRDENAHVRLRAIDLAGMRAPVPRDSSAAFRAAAAAAPLACASHDAIASVLRGAIDALPVSTPSRATGEVSWHAAAHAIVALARLRPAEARERLPRLVSHGQWQVRQYATRAAAALADTAALERLAYDAHANVRETAIESLSALVGHAADAIYVEALDGHGVQAIRVAALALKGSTRAGVAEAAMRVHARLVREANSSSHDTRLALLELAGKSAADDTPVTQAYALPPDAVPLALGADIRLRVTLAERSGGGEFVVKLRGDVAPMMGARILDLVRKGWYHGLAWHRVEPDFVIQGLGPADNEYVGHPQFLRDELGTVPHVRGTLGMSTRGHDTGDGQWFINLRDNLRLGRDYTVWAEVVDGIEVVDGVLEGDVVERIVIIR